MKKQKTDMELSPLKQVLTKLDPLFLEGGRSISMTSWAVAILSPLLHVQLVVITEF